MSSEKELAERTVRMCRKLGADQAEALVIRQGEKATEVFDRQVRLNAASEVTRITVRLFRNHRGTVVTGCGDSERALKGLIERALLITRHTSPDKFLGVADPKDLGKEAGDFRIFDQPLAELSVEQMGDIALAAESAVTRRDRRTANFITSSMQVSTQHVALCTSHGFCESYAGTSATLLLKAVIDRDATQLGAQSSQADDEKLAGGTGLTARSLGGLDLEKVADRTIQRLTSKQAAKSPPSGSFPIVFAPSAARFVPSLFMQLCSGPAVMFMQSSYLGGVEDRICSPLITVVDDATLSGGVRTVPFDHEGVKPRRQVVVDRGVLKQYLLNSYYARALKRRSTGNALASNDARFDVRAANAYVERGSATPESILSEIKQGFYVTGFLSNTIPVAVNFAQGAYGYWIENGRLTFPVRGATVSAPLKEMLNNIVGVGDDFDASGAVISPTLLVSKMDVTALV